ncbi:MAG: DUF5615 family PIN-like protein [Caldilineaceae bacterium]|nr:DUF5615 family PIN-like protein [Caldilineaceae bacterium]MBP8107174.1 DUF5615 family PIN-like protein [Caldilineaceae bacterium]MBP8121518.1 DUF5615 family PIN-like protein [Caldilineaceae bacterium]MBP9073838.1 DUF5615 family PIN-like protein [Caldilineaceae bacterium]
MAAKVRFYLDENVPVEVARQLRSRDIDVVTARDLGLLGASDRVHLENATALRRVLCTFDADYLRLVSEGMAHAGIVFGQQSLHYVGDWVNWLTLIHAVYAPREMVGRVEYM